MGGAAHFLRKELAFLVAGVPQLERKGERAREACGSMPWESREHRIAVGVAFRQQVETARRFVGATDDKSSPLRSSETTPNPEARDPSLYDSVKTTKTNQN